MFIVAVPRSKIDFINEPRLIGYIFWTNYSLNLFPIELETCGPNITWPDETKSPMPADAYFK